MQYFLGCCRIYALTKERKSPQFFLETDDLLDLTLVTFSCDKNIP